MSQTTLKLGSRKLWGYKYVAHNKGRIYQLQYDEEVVTRVMKQEMFIYCSRTPNAYLVPHKVQCLS
jgi:hypothetical protein